MKKSILNLGKALNKADQKKINGGFAFCDANGACPSGYVCQDYICVIDGSGGPGGGGSGGGCSYIKVLCEYEGDTCCIY